MSEPVVKLKINQRMVEARQGMTILESARQNKIFIPSLCDLEGLPAFAGCRLCLVQVKGQAHFLPACQTTVEEGMEVITSSEELENLRRANFELILSSHPYFCLFCDEKASCDELKATMTKALEPSSCVFCPRDGDCQLQQIADYFKVGKVAYEFEDRGLELWQKDPFIIHNPNLCVLCGRCVRVCSEARGEGVLSFVNRGTRTAIGTFFGRSLKEANCSFCGACLDVCPTAAFFERGVVSVRGQKIEKKKFVCPVCGGGCQLEAEFFSDGRLRRILPASGDQPVFYSGCRRGRFGLKEILSKLEQDRQPTIKKDGKPYLSSWSEALAQAAESLKKYKPEEIAFIFTGENPVDSLQAFLKLGQGLGIRSIFWFYPEFFLNKISLFEEENGIDIRRLIKLKELAKFQTFVLVNLDLKTEAPTVWLEIRKQLGKGARLISLDSGVRASVPGAAVDLKCWPGKENLALLSLLNQVIKKSDSRIIRDGYGAFLKELKKIPEEGLAQETELKSSDLARAAQILLENKPVAFLFGQRFLRQSAAKENLTALWNLSLGLEGCLIPVTSKINELWMEKISYLASIKAISDLNFLEHEIRNKKIKVLYLLGDIPLKEKPELLIVQNPLQTPLASKADIFLPETNCLESSGYLVDLEGKVKTSQPQDERDSERLSGLRIFKSLGAMLGVRLEPVSEKALVETVNKGSEEKTTGQLNYLPLERCLTGKIEVKTSPRKKDPEEFEIIIGQNLDSYAGKALAEESTGFKFIDHPDGLWLNETEARSLGMTEGMKVIVETEHGNLSLVVRLTRSISRGRAMFNPILNDSLKLQLFNQGIVKAFIRVKK